MDINKNYDDTYTKRLQELYDEALQRYLDDYTNGRIVIGTFCEPGVEKTKKIPISNEPWKTKNKKKMPKWKRKW